MRDNISKENLEKIYIENTNKKASEILGVSEITLVKMINDAGIEKKGKGYSQKYFIVD